MAKLVIPVKGKHLYVVGIDFGHGETSAAICPIEWGKDAGLRESKVTDIDMDIAARKKVIPSAICRKDGYYYIGDEVFEHVTDNNGIRLAFKQKPASLNGEQEKLMMDYMNAIYKRIRESCTELKDGNHIVYIARPSGWVDESCKELYRQMALKAGLPLGGLTSESRAAIFYAKSPSVNFANEISRGAIVFDLGSSTLDFTYLSDDNKPVDFGYNLGASLIDNAILERMVLKDEDVKEFVEKFPEYIDSLRFKARKFKEDAYSRNENSKTIGGFPLGNIIDDTEPSYDDYADVYVRLRINNLAELNALVEEHTQYMNKLREALLDFKTKKILEKSINGVFLTGGASRMNFIRPLIAETLSLPLDKVKIDNDNPSLTISRGIALLGATDAITTVLVEELKKQLPQLVSDESKTDSLSRKLATNITKEAWNVVESTCHSWINYGTSTDEDELKEKLKRNIEIFKNSRISAIVNDTLQDYLRVGSEDVRKKMNEIISRYAPGREIKMSGKVKIDSVGDISSSLSDMSAAISEICDSISNWVGDALWAALGLFLWGVIAVGYYIIKGAYNYFRDDKDKRKDKADEVLNQKNKICSEVETKIIEHLKSNMSFKTKVSNALSNYFTEQMEQNLQQVTIPIE